MSATYFPLGASEHDALASVSEPAEHEGVFVLAMHSPPDNRLSPAYISDCLLPALEHVEQVARTRGSNGTPCASALVLTGASTREGASNKFFSNGLDLPKALKTPYFFRDVFGKLLARLITFPLFTVAAINGHCFAGGLCLALATDYRVMRASKAWCCMNEIDFAAPVPRGMAAVLRSRLSQPTVAKALLTAHRFTGPEALECGIANELVDGQGAKDEALLSLRRAVQVASAQVHRAKSGVVTLMKEVVYEDTLRELAQPDDALIDIKAYNALALARLPKQSPAAKL